eukprot:scaffold19616_cov36-Prasinocladus_malaysianus.AAC.1
MLFHVQHQANNTQIKLDCQRLLGSRALAFDAFPEYPGRLCLVWGLLMPHPGRSLAISGLYISAQPALRLLSSRSSLSRFRPHMGAWLSRLLQI